MSTKIKSRRFYLVNLVWAITISALVSACGGGAPPPTAEPGPTSKDPTVQVVPEAKDVRVISTETVPQNLCGEGISATFEITRSRTITHTVSLSESISVNASGQAGIPGVGNVQVGTAIASTYGLTYGEADTITRRQNVTTQAGTNVNYEIDLFEVWQTGTIIISDGNKEVGRYHYEFRTDFGIELKEPKHLDCPVSTPTPTSTASPTLTPLPTATALIDAYDGTWFYSGNFSGTLSFPLYRVIIENVNSQNNTATFSVCRCMHKTSCEQKFNLTPLFAKAHFEDSKLVATRVSIDEERTREWKLEAIKIGQNLRVTVEEYINDDRVGGPEDFSLQPPKLPFPGGVGGVTATDVCQPPPVLYLGP